jgi:5-methylcytosine-specific restriction endonuclease McrA
MPDMADDNVPDADAIVTRNRARWKRYYYRNREAAIAASKRWQAKNQEYLRAYRDANKEKRAETSRQWAKANPQRVVAHTQRWQEANPEKVLAYRAANTSKTAARNKAWKRANPEMVRANVRKWHAAHPDVVKAWRKANPEAWRAQVQARKARVANAEGRHTGEELKALLKQQNWRCGYCQRSIRTKYSVDHIQPLSRGGSNWITNIQLLCQSCNSAKQDADPLDYARRIGRLL